MELTAPAALVTLALVPPYVWLRLRQRRPPVRPVSSLLLWRAVGDPAPEALRRRERLWNLALLLEALSLAAVCFSFAGPLLRRDVPCPVHLVLALDDSASLLAGDRWERLRTRARAIVDGLAPFDRVTVLTGDRERPGLSPARAREAVAELAPRAAEDDLPGLVARARALAAGEEGGVARVLTDRVPPDADGIESVGGPTDNAGIVRAAVEGNVVFVSVAATSPRAVTVEVTDGDRVLSTASVRVEDDLSAPVVIDTDLPEAAQVRLTARDDLAADDVVALVRRPAVAVRVDGAASSELLRALSVQPGARVVQGSDGSADLVVLDRTWPGDLPDGPCVLIAPARDLPVQGEAIEAPIDRWNDEHALLEGLVPEGVGLRRAHAFREPPGWSEEDVLATAGGKKVLVLGRVRGAPVLYVGFDLSLRGGGCSWAAHPHFPVFWNRVLGRLARPGEAWEASGLLSLRETRCASDPRTPRGIDTRDARMVSSPRFLAAESLIAAAAGFVAAFLLLRSAEGCPRRSSS